MELRGLLPPGISSSPSLLLTTKKYLLAIDYKKWGAEFCNPTPVEYYC